MSGLESGERREVRIPVALKLAKIQEDGAYISVTGELSSAWTTMSEGVKGSFHLDSRPIHRLPEEPAELEIILSRIRDRAALLNLEEYTEVHVHDQYDRFYNRGHCLGNNLRPLADLSQYKEPEYTAPLEIPSLTL